MDNMENCQGSEKCNRVSFSVANSQFEPKLDTNPSVKTFKLSGYLAIISL